MEKEIIIMYMKLKVMRIIETKNIQASFRAQEVLDAMMRNCPVTLEELRAI